VCDGSERENQRLLEIMTAQGMAQKLTKYENWYVYTYAHVPSTPLVTVSFKPLRHINHNEFLVLSSWLVNTDPADVARVESRTYISTKNESDVVPYGNNPHKGALPNWISPKQLDLELTKRFPRSMDGEY